MSETVTEQNQLHLVSIISIAEDKLQSNFIRILNRLNHHEKTMENNRNQIEALSVRINSISKNLQERFEADEQRSHQMMVAGNKQISILSKNVADLTQKFAVHQKNFNSLQKAQASLRLFIDQDCEARSMNLDNTKQKIRNLEYQISQIGATLGKKQNTSEVVKIKNTLADLSQQMSKIDNEQKFVQFKLDKFEINNQKNQKNQMNKEMLMMKDLQQRIRTQLAKNELRGRLIMNQKKNTQSVESAQESSKVTIKNQNSIQDLTSIERPFSIRENVDRPDYQGSYAMIQSGQMNQKMLNKVHQSLSQYERRLQCLEKEVKEMSEWSQYSQKQKKISNQELQQKINALKPEFSRLWAKCDSLEDKTAFMERRLEEKAKQIAHIMQVLKETQSSKFDEKLKMLQTELFTNIKDIRVKLENKVNSNDYEKFSRTTVQKMQNMCDQIILKCDKLQVKKALLFLESKIKQIILVISEEEENEKDALLTKKQIKCISCDKEIEKFLGTTSGSKGNWDGFPYKEHSNDALGKFGMTSFGSLARKLKRLDNKEIPVLSNKRNKDSTHSESKADFN